MVRIARGLRGWNFSPKNQGKKKKKGEGGGGESATETMFVRGLHLIWAEREKVLKEISSHARGGEEVLEVLASPAVGNQKNKKENGKSRRPDGREQEGLSDGGHCETRGGGGGDIQSQGEIFGDQKR